MFTFVWKDELATGNATLDAQHKQLFQIANDLLDACSSGRSAGKINSTMQFLLDYAARHLKDEEKMQRKYGYPDYPNHKKQHEAFQAATEELAKQYSGGGGTVQLVTAISSSVSDWLFNHIKQEDRKLAEYIHSQGE